MTPITTDTPTLYFEPTAHSFTHRVDTPKRTLTDQIIELVALSPGITAKEISVALCRDTAAVKGALNQLSFGRLTIVKDNEGARPINRYYLGPLAREVWANGAWRPME